MTSSKSITSRLSSLYSKLPRYVRLIINTSIGLTGFFAYLPFGILMSQSRYIASFDISVVSLLAINQLINQSVSRSTVMVCVGLIGQSVLRYWILSIFQPTNGCRSINQSNIIAASSLIFPFIQTIMYGLLRKHSAESQVHQSTNPYPFHMFIVSFILSLLVSLSVIWVPTSHELAYESETALLRETGLLEHVVRGKAASLRYFLLDHPLNQLPHQHGDGPVHTHYQDDVKDPSLISSRAHNQSTDPSTHKSRPALVCLHGYGAAGLFFAHSMSRWSHIVDVYSVDLLGFGLSSHDPFTATSPAEAELHFVESLERWRIAMNLDRIILLGHSLGGMIAAAYALRYPQHTISVLLASPVGIPDPPSDLTRVGPARLKRFRPLITWLWELGLTPASGLHFLGPIGPRVVDWIINARFGRLSHVSCRPSFSTYMYHINAHTGSGLATLNALIVPGAYARLPLGERMKRQMQVPTYFIFGEHDWMFNDVTHEVVRVIKERGVHASLERVSNSGHQVSFENTQEFERVVSKRIEEVIGK